MSMDDTYRLVEAILMDARMTRLRYAACVDRPLSPGSWLEAEILNASIVADHGRGVVNGYVWYRLDGEEHPTDATFHTLWLEGWTTFEWRRRMSRPQAKWPRQRGGKRDGK